MQQQHNCGGGEGRGGEGRGGEGKGRGGEGRGGLSPLDNYWVSWARETANQCAVALASTPCTFERGHVKSL